MPKRFNKIKSLIKKAAKFGVDVTTDDNIKAYLNFREGTSTTYKTTARTKGASQVATLLPFYTRRFTADFRHAVKVSGRAATQITTMGATTELGIDLGAAPDATTPTTQARGKLVKGFSPAKVVVKAGTGTAATSKKSGITLLDYKASGGSSYTFPFGAINTAGKKTYVEQCGNLTKELAKGNNSVSFKQERPGFA